MVRRLSVLSLFAAVLGSAAGCRNDCGGGCFTSTHGSAPCRLTGHSAPDCCETAGVPVSGGAMPATLVPGAGVPLMPAPYGGAPTELPYPGPAPTDLIPRQGVPVQPAIPTPAPGSVEFGSNVLPAPKLGVPVKDSK